MLLSCKLPLIKIIRILFDHVPLEGEIIELSARCFSLDVCVSTRYVHFPMLGLCASCIGVIGTVICASLELRRCLAETMVNLVGT